MINFNNTYARLPGAFSSPVNSTNAFHPSLIAFNEALALELGLSRANLSDEELARYFSATAFLEGSEPVAMAYAGHQFGHFNPQLGDGRAMLLGEFLAPDGKRFDVHLKGSGQTIFSRRGDGRSALGPVIREYLISEAMHALGIPTTRTLCAVRTGETVFREEELPGAVLTRIAQSHIRVGTFEYFARKGDNENLRALADYAIERLYPGLSYFEFWQAVARKQVALILKWMSVGFIHGVMNTDNMTISGETIDYGPCAFMDHFNFNKVFSSIDQFGRYAYANQPQIALWNLTRLAECLLVLTGEEAQGQFVAELEKLQKAMGPKVFEMVSSKLGLHESDPELTKEWMTLLENNQLDFTLSFIDLERHMENKKTFSDIEKVLGMESFLAKLKSRNVDLAQMKRLNPLTIPRNHQVQKAIKASELGNDSEFFKLHEVLKHPFRRLEELTPYQLPPTKEEEVCKTFCGT